MEINLNNKKKIAALLWQSFFVVVFVEVVALKLWQADFRVPFNYQGDALWFVVPVKGMIDNGWVYDIPQLSAPFGLSAAGFPSMTNFDWLIMKGISLFVPDAGAVLNIFWLFSMVLTTWSATIALHLIGAKNWLALAAAIIYAFLPYAFLRNVGHISLVYYTVPLLALLTINIAKGGDHPQAKLIRIFGYGAAIAQGFNYIYFSFFAIVLFVFSGVLGFIQNKSKKPIKEAVIAVALIAFATSINLAPSFISWSQHGKPPDMGYKSAAEAEVYGLKLRKLLVPNEANQLPIISHWARSDKNSNFPNENENVTARLGPMAAIGFLFLLMVSAGMDGQYFNSKGVDVKIVASLSLFTFLFTTVGGLGAIFNQILPDFRGYNRFSVFLAFFSLVGLVLLIQELIVKIQTKILKIIFIAIFGGFAIFSLYDQALDARHLINRREANLSSAKQERELVRNIEIKFPKGTSVFQLPITGFPPDAGTKRMSPYDHAKPFLWSNGLMWSWPSFSQRHRSWLDQLNGLEGEALAESLVLSKFDLIWIDRFGYEDNGDKIISSLLLTGASEVAAGASQRYAVLSLAPIEKQLKKQLGEVAFEKQSDKILNAPILNWSNGFYGPEHNSEGRIFRWSRSNSEIVIANAHSAPWIGTLSFYIASGTQGEVVVSSGSHSNIAKLGPVPVLIEFPVTVAPSGKTIVNFSTTAEKMSLPSGETRDLYFYIMDSSLKSISN